MKTYTLELNALEVGILKGIFSTLPMTSLPALDNIGKQLYRIEQEIRKEDTFGKGPFLQPKVGEGRPIQRGKETPA